jgi:heat shock protein HslJ
MKRRIVPLVFFCLLLMGCPPLPHHYVPLYKIEYKSFGRNGSEYILLEKSTLKYMENRQDTITKRLKNKHYRALHNYLKEINLDSLPLLEVPSKKHQFDGALATTLIITDAKPEVYKTSTFDNDNPPKEIKGIIEYIKSISKK